MNFLKPSATHEGSKIGLKGMQYGLNATIALLVLAGIGSGLTDHNSKQDVDQVASASASISETQNLSSLREFSTVSAVTLVSTSNAKISGKQYKTTIWLNLRSGAGFNYSVIGAGVTGTTVTATGKVSGVWYQVKMGNKTGWMSSQYLRAVSVSTSSSNSIVGLKAFAASKVGAQQAQCLSTLWERESNWNYRAINPAFSPRQASIPEYQAYGIVQAAPGSKMASAGADWKTNPRTQIIWGINYIKGRYGSPCAALNFHNIRGWY